MIPSARTPDTDVAPSALWPRITLASGSPRRRELLAAAGVPLEVRPSNADETWPPSEKLQTALLSVTRRKLAHLGDEIGWALAADTIVVFEGAVLGKPADAAAAHAMLKRLSGQVHVVMTGFVLVMRGSDGVQHSHAQTVQTEVRFRALSDQEIASYLATGDSLDKAGAYGIQSLGGFLVDTVAGSYTNIVGLPLCEVLAAIRSLQKKT
jgi:septum formation protein